jgi:tetratricopeptide (TPR) repeat protein
MTIDDDLGQPVIDALAGLVAKNLVQRGEVDGESRFSMLETLREYAQAKLVEHDKFAASSDWSEAQDRLERALAHPGAQARIPARAYALFALSGIVAEIGDRRHAHALIDEARDIALESGDPYGQAHLTYLRGLLRRDSGDAEGARADLEESLRRFELMDDRERVAHMNVTLAQVSVMREQPDQAEAWLEAGLGYYREHRQGTIPAWALNHLGHVAQLRGDFARARGLQHDSLEAFGVSGDPKELGPGWAHESLAGAAALARLRERIGAAALDSAVALALGGQNEQNGEKTE